MIVVGSKALQYYISDIGRKIHDWDIYISTMDFINLDKSKMKLIKEMPSGYLYELDGEILELKTQHHFEPTDHIIFNDTLRISQNFIKTPIGIAKIPDIDFIYEMKLATATYINEPKHQHDLDLLEPICVTFGKKYSDFYNIRLEETRVRVENSKKVKYDFFHKYHIPEYILHDYLHEIIAAGMNITIPTYQRITDGDVSISEQQFNKLTHEQKISLMVEESLVLGLERWFVPQMVENGINYRLIDMFFNDNEGLPTYQILKHCCITGLKGEAEYITGFARLNFFEIEKKWCEAKALINKNGGFPSSFFNTLFKLRTDYKTGKIVSIT